MAMVNTTRAAWPGKAPRQAASPGTQWAEVMAASRPPGGSIEKAERRWRRSASWRIRPIPGVAENGGFISTTVGRTPGQEVGEGLGVVAGDGGAGKQPREQAGADRCDLVQIQPAGGVLAERALRHHGEHPGAGAGLQHDIARPDRGGLERGIGERQRRRELLEADLLLGALRVRGLQRGDRREHVEHPAGAVRARAGPLAHGAPVAADEHHDRGLGRLVGVLPDPGALGVARAMGAGHGIAERGGIEGPARFEHGEQGPGGVEERGGTVLDGAGGAGGRDGCRGKLRARGRVRRRVGVEHGVLRSGRTWNRRPCGESEGSRAASPGLPPAGCLASGRRGPGTRGIRR